MLEDLAASQYHGMTEAVALPTGGSLRIELNGIVSGRLPSVLDPLTTDHRLLACCLNLADAGDDPVLVTKDIALRIKGAHLSKVIFCGDLTQVDKPCISPFGGMAADRKVDGLPSPRSCNSGTLRPLTSGGDGFDRPLNSS